jgi:hypothetical protein
MGIGVNTNASTSAVAAEKWQQASQYFDGLFFSSVCVFVIDWGLYFDCGLKEKRLRVGGIGLQPKLSLP